MTADNEVPFEKSMGRAQVECDQCHRWDTTGAWCYSYNEHPGMCCDCFDTKWKESPHS